MISSHHKVIAVLIWIGVASCLVMLLVLGAVWFGVRSAGPTAGELRELNTVTAPSLERMNAESTAILENRTLTVRVPIGMHLENAYLGVARKGYGEYLWKCKVGCDDGGELAVGTIIMSTGRRSSPSSWEVLLSHGMTGVWEVGPEWVIETRRSGVTIWPEDDILVFAIRNAEFLRCLTSQDPPRIEIATEGVLQPNRSFTKEVVTVP